MYLADMASYDSDFFFSLMFVIVFALVSFTFLAILARGVSEWNQSRHTEVQ